jgi:hypothetical protein
MSVMQQLQDTAGQTPVDFPRFSKNRAVSKKQMQDAEAMMMTAPIPGQSLTQNPESRMPYEQPSKFSDIQEFIDETFVRFTDEDAMPDLLDAMRMGLPVEHIAEKYLTKAFRDGEINPDMMLLCIEPTIYMLISIATFAEIDPVLYPEDPMLDEEVNASHTDLYKKATQEMLTEDDGDGKVTVNDFQAPANAPQNLLQRTEQAVAKVKGDM